MCDTIFNYGAYKMVDVKMKKQNKCIIKESSAYWFDEEERKSVCNLAIKQFEEQLAIYGGISAKQSKKKQNVSKLIT